MRNEKRNVSDSYDVEWFQDADGVQLDKAGLIDMLGITPTGTPEADVLSGTALGERVVALATRRMKSRRWRDGDIGCANIEWRIAA